MHQVAAGVDHDDGALESRRSVVHCAKHPAGEGHLAGTAGGSAAAAWDEPRPLHSPLTSRAVARLPSSVPAGAKKPTWWISCDDWRLSPGDPGYARLPATPAPWSGTCTPLGGAAPPPTQAASTPTISDWELLHKDVNRVEAALRGKRRWWLHGVARARAPIRRTQRRSATSGRGVSPVVKPRVRELALFPFILLHPLLKIHSENCFGIT